LFLGNREFPQRYAGYVVNHPQMAEGPNGNRELPSSAARDATACHLPTWEYNSWKNMKERCSRATRPEYPNYGGRGIRVCERWLLANGEGFANFLADMGPRPQGMTLDRINPQGHYEPTNCCWVTAKVQRENQSRVIWQDAEPPPVEAADVMEARVEEYEGMSAY
jgi:hypothetical protein